MFLDPLREILGLSHRGRSAKSLYAHLAVEALEERNLLAGIWSLLPFPTGLLQGEKLDQMILLSDGRVIAHVHLGHVRNASATRAIALS